MTIQSNPETHAISANQARQLVNQELLFHCGQSFIVDTPELIDGFWMVPVWLSHHQQGKIKQIREISVDVNSGEILFSESDRDSLKSEARQLLSGI